MILSLPVAAGDTGLLLILDRAAGEFKRLGGVVDPVDQRHHDLSDAIFLPGFVGPWGEELAGGPTASGDVIGTTTGAGLLTEDESQGFAIDDLETQLADVRTANEKLELQAADLRSLSGVELTSQTLALEPADGFEYLPASGAVAVSTR
jgi:hypothetical protein